MQFTTLYVPRKASWIFKAFFFLMAFYFLKDAYECFVLGEIFSHGSLVYESKNPSNFYSALAKKMAFGLVSLYFATFGIRSEKKQGTDSATTDGQHDKKED